MSDEMKGTYAGKVFQVVKDKYKRELNDTVLNVDIVDICRFMVLHDKFAKDGKYYDETSDAKTDDELEYKRLIIKIHEIIDKKSKYLKVIDELNSVCDYNDHDEINNIVKSII